MHLTLKSAIAINKLLSSEIDNLQSNTLPNYKDILGFYGRKLDKLASIMDRAPLKTTDAYRQYSYNRSGLLKTKKRLKTLHIINRHLKVQIRLCKSCNDDVVYLRFTAPELQFLLQLLRGEIYFKYNFLEFVKSEAGYHYKFAVKDGSESGKLSFKMLNKMRDERRKMSKEVKVLETVIKVVKRSLRSNLSTEISPAKLYKATSSSRFGDVATKYFGYIFNKIWRG